MRSKTPTLHCDECEVTWDIDYYECTASSVNGVRITLEQRAPGWVCTRDTDICPDCVQSRARDGA